MHSGEIALKNNHYYHYYYNMHYDHEVKFRSLIEYGMNDFCARGLTL